MPASAAPPSCHRIRLLHWCRIFAVFGLLGLLIVGIFLDRYGQRERAQPAQAIVILGSNLIGPHQAGDSLQARIRKAIALYRQGWAPMLLCTGGVEKTLPAESVVITELLLSAGIPAQAITREERSTSTYENVRYATEICRAHGWTRVIVVSDPYHLWRGQFLFARKGITAYPSPALDCRRNRLPLLRIGWTAREALLVVRDVLRAGADRH